jgi:hypothetical protein
MRSTHQLSNEEVRRPKGERNISSGLGEEIQNRRHQRKIPTVLPSGLVIRAIRRILGVFRTALALPAALEAGLPPPLVRLERLSVLYGLRVQDLPREHPVSKAIEETTLPRETRPPTNSTEMRTLKD